MESLEFLNDNPKLKRILLNSKLLDIIPGGFSIATDASCQTIIHNPIAAKFLRIEPWGKLSYSALEPPSLNAYHNGKPLEAKDLATQRAAWKGEEVDGLEIEFIWEDGVSKIGRFSSSPLRDENGNICGAITTMEDITDLVHMARELDDKNKMLEKTMKELQQSKELFYNTVENMMDSVTLFSAVRDDKDKIIDFTLDYLNQAACKNSNKTREEVTGHRLLSFSHNIVESGLFDAYCGVVETGEPFSSESIDYSSTDNKYVEGAYDNRTIKMGDGIVVTYRNITERKRSEIELLRASDERFSKVFHHSPHMMAIMGKSDQRYKAVNLRFLEQRGFSPEEVIGKTSVEIGIPEAKNQEFFDLFEKNGSVVNFDGFVSTKEGLKDALISAEKILLDGEECLLFAFNDITELKRMQAELARLDRFNLIGQMAAGIGHEIRNPMTVIRGYLQLMIAKPELEPYHYMIETMINEIDRANSIITEFLSLARHQSTEQKRQDINNILIKLYPLLEADTYTQNKQIVLRAQNTPEILLDYKEISQLILNLCRNGLESMPEYGTLTLGTYVEQDQVVLFVQDEGSGISEEYLDKLGTPFFTTKDNGTGLGLATCYSIAERHNARIAVESSPCGTVFKVFFPQDTNQ